jgi:hypothetical protein
MMLTSVDKNYIRYSNERTFRKYRKQRCKHSPPQTSKHAIEINAINAMYIPGFLPKKNIREYCRKTDLFDQNANIKEGDWTYIFLTILIVLILIVWFYL